MLSQPVRMILMLSVLVCVNVFGETVDYLSNRELIKKILEIIPSSEVISVKPIKKTIQEE